MWNMREKITIFYKVILYRNLSMLGFRLLSEKNPTKMIAQSDRSALYNYFFLQNDRSFYRHGAVL